MQRNSFGNSLYDGTITDGKLLAIPRNGNLSNGMMIGVENMKGNPTTKQ